MGSCLLVPTSTGPVCKCGGKDLRVPREELVVTGGYSWNSILARTEALNMTEEEGRRWR